MYEPDVQKNSWANADWQATAYDSWKMPSISKYLQDKGFDEMPMKTDTTWHSVRAKRCSSFFGYCQYCESSSGNSVSQA